MAVFDEALCEAPDEEVFDGMSTVDSKSDKIYFVEKVFLDGLDDAGLGVYEHDIFEMM